MDSFETNDFLQANDPKKVIEVVHAVNQNYYTDHAIEQYIGTNSDGRQGRYYRLAAQKLGLVSTSNNYTILTDSGRYFVGLQTHDQINYIRTAILCLPIFREAINLIQSKETNLEDLKSWFKEKYPGEQTTAHRRFSTFINYLVFCGIYL